MALDSEHAGETEKKCSESKIRRIRVQALRTNLTSGRCREDTKGQQGHCGALLWSSLRRSGQSLLVCHWHVDQFNPVILGLCGGN